MPGAPTPTVSFPELLRESADQVLGPLGGMQPGTIASRLRIAATELECEEDARAIRSFADVMIAKMERKSMEGVTGWPRIPVAHLWAMLRENVGKGDPVDIAIFAMMIHHNAEHGYDTGAG